MRPFVLLGLLFRVRPARGPGAGRAGVPRAARRRQHVLVRDVPRAERAERRRHAPGGPPARRPDAGGGGGPGGGCAKTHPKVGWYADLATYAHGVKGRATVTDDCTVTLSGFFYDGNGIDVRLFGALGKDFARGFPIGGQLYRPGQPYVDVTLPMALPPGKTLDDLDSVSVWCVAARHNFGDGTFRAP